jgi:hypothetical protein
VLAGLALGAAGCGSGGGDNATATSTTASTPTAAATAAVNHIGSAVVVPTGSTKLEVRVTRVIDPLHGVKLPPAFGGDRVVAVRFSVDDVGKAPFDGSPSDYATIRTSGGENPPLAPVTRGPCARFEATSLKIAPGATTTGCVAYGVTPGHQAATFTFDAGSGNKGTWQLK